MKKLLPRRNSPEARNGSGTPALIVGLRNPGSEYQGTRHNVGGEVVASLARRFGLSWRRGPRRVAAELAEGRREGRRVLLTIPLRYVNESGGAVRSLLSYYKAGTDKLLVIHDDIDLAFGRLRLQMGGGTGGHNGLKSLVESLGSEDFHRLKVGVGRPRGQQDPADFVLERFSKAERAEVDVLVEDAAEVVERWLSDPARAQEQAAHRAR